MASGKKRSFGSLFLGITARALMVIAAFLLVLSYLSMFFNPAKAWMMTLFGLFFLPLLLLNLFLLLWALVRRSKACLIPLVALIPACFVLGKYVQFSRSENTPSAGEGVRILSYNVGRFGLTDLDRRSCADSVVAFLKRQDADIICLQEFFFRDSKSLRAYLEDNFKGYNAEYYVYTTDAGCYGNVTLSRFPLRGKGKIDFDKSSNLTLYGDYDIGGKRLRIYNCHFQSYNLSLSGLVRNARRDYRKTLSDTEEKMRASILLRPLQVDQVLQDIEECPTLSVVAGDFNDNPVSYTYYRLSRGRRDTFEDAGKGFGATYSALWPLLRIDYVLIPKAFKATEHVVNRSVKWSDHYPVAAKIVIPDGEENS